MATESTTHIFASLYAFSDVAKNEIVEEFLASEAGHNADVQHAPENLFVVRCAKNDPTSFLNFLEHVNKFIAAERGKVPELFESVKLKRVADTQTETVLDLEDAIGGNEDENFSPVDQQEDAVESVLIPHEIFAQSWRSNVIKDVSEIGLRFSNSLLKALGELTNCRVELEADGGTITVRAERGPDVEKAIMKLKSIDEWLHLRSTFPLSYDFCYVEGELDIMLQMVALKDLPDRKLQTTLTPSDLPPVKNLGSHLVVTMLKKGSIVPTVPNGRPPSNAKESQMWRSHLFGPYGDENIPITPRLDDRTSSPDRLVSDQSNGRSVDQWIKQSAAAVLADPFLPSTLPPTLPRAPPSPVHKPQPEPEVEPPPARKRHIRVRKPMGLSIPNTPVADPPDQERKPSDPIPTTSHEVVNDTSSSDVNTTRDNSTQSSATKSLEDDTQVVADVDLLTNDLSSSGPFEEARGQMYKTQGATDSSHQYTVTEDEQVVSSKALRSPPPIKAPYMPAEQKASSSLDDSVSDPTWRDQVVVSVPATNLIDVAPSRQPLQERVQHESEVDTRSVKRTMHQRKPAALAGSSNTLATLYKNFELATTEILKLAQKAQGPVTLQMEIGRILIGPPPGHSEIKKRPFAVIDWSLVFPGGRKQETPFTKVLTTSANDADFIRELKLSVKRKMLVTDGVKRRVTYNFNCRTRTNDQVMVEVDERGVFKVWCNRSLVGALNWHFPKRSWDARMVISCSDHVGNEILEAAKDLVENLRVVPAADRKAFELSVKSSSGKLQVLSGFLRREALHQSSEHPEILVNLCEVQDLNLWQPHGLKGPYEGSLISSPSNAINAGKLWWEVTVSSVEVERHFHANEHLKVGSSATWKPADILATDLVSHLCNVTRDLVIRIDSVGCLNKGSKGGSGTKTSDRDKKAEEVYW